MFSLFIDYLFLAWCIKGKNRYCMEDYIDQIEKFLKGKMTMREETSFKVALGKDKTLRSLAFLLAILFRRHNN